MWRIQQFNWYLQNSYKAINEKENADKENDKKKETGSSPQKWGCPDKKTQENSGLRRRNERSYPIPKPLMIP